MKNFKQSLKRKSVLQIFVEKLLCCRKIRKGLAVYGLKRHLVIYYNDGHNILRLFDTIPNFIFTAIEAKTPGPFKL